MLQLLHDEELVLLVAVALVLRVPAGVAVACVGPDVEAVLHAAVADGQLALPPPSQPRPHAVGGQGHQGQACTEHGVTVVRLCCVTMLYPAARG